MSLFLAVLLSWMVHPSIHSPTSNMEAYPMYLLMLVVNVVVGALIGFTASLVLESIYAAGNVVNNQIGLSSAMIMDPSNGNQTMLLETLFNYITLSIFMYLGGMHWMILALKHSLEVFPVHDVMPAIRETIDLAYLIQLSSNVLLIGVQLVSPVIVVTMTVDLMLGVVNRTAQQMPVFQLSYALKPAIGIAVMWLTMSTFLESVMQYLKQHANIF
jgi:flagellar biosynthesis protein FliR